MSKKICSVLFLVILAGCQSEFVTVDGIKMSRTEATERAALAGKCKYPPGYNENWNDLGLPAMRNADGSLYCEKKNDAKEYPSSKK